jgi:transposase-like protein
MPRPRKLDNDRAAELLADIALAQTLTVRELCRKYGISPETLRTYTRKGHKRMPRYASTQEARA